MSACLKDKEIKVDGLPKCRWCGGEAKAVQRGKTFFVGCRQSSIFLGSLFYAPVNSICIEYVWAHTLDEAVAKWKERCEKP